MFEGRNIKIIKCVNKHVAIYRNCLCFTWRKSTAD